MGQHHDYTRKRGVEHSEIVAPQNAPDWMLDREILWNTVERVEKRRDAQLAREIQVALPRELGSESYAGLVRRFVQTEFVDQGMIADFAIHDGRARDGGEQPHAHILLTTRALMDEGFGPKNREWNSVDKLEGWRARWAEHVNAELERNGHDAQIDHRTLDAQQAEAECQAERAREAGDTRTAEKQEQRAVALDREPEPKLGPIANAMEKLGHASRRGDERREVEARNVQRQTLHEQARDLARQIAEATRQVAEAAQRRLRDLAQRLENAYRIVRERAALNRSTISEIETARESPTSDRAAPLMTVARNPMLGRAKSTTLDVAREKTAGDLLGRVSGEEREKVAPDLASLLGRGLQRHPPTEDRSRDDDRGR